MTVRSFSRVLIANRGEIALRLIRACRELGLESVAVYSDADADAPHVRAADQAVRLGPAPAVESYLRADRLVEAAQATGAQAVHPGYGFLAEQAAFAEACEAAGLVFVGPAPATLAGLGDKLAARRTAREASVPVVPGTLEPARFDRPAARAQVAILAEEVGFPLLVKAAAGGGGRGMRRVDHPSELVAALEAASHEAETAFGDGSLYLERFVEEGRHIEVQLLGDAFGTIVALGERDCSAQRRHQKLVEEAPAPGLDRAERERLGELAVRLAQAVGLQGAATCEFLREPDGSVWFLEVNVRLQVEHGVTELVTGLDLVHEQFRIAAGEPLSKRVLAAAARASTPARHAVEVRLSAEDPAAEFAPQPGRLSAWVEAAGPGIRIDGWVGEGTVISDAYDPLLAKLLVVAEDRPAALARLARALDETVVGGVQTTLPFHRWLIRQPDFRAGGIGTEWVTRHWDGAAERARAVAAAGLVALAADGAAEPAAAELDGVRSAHADAWVAAGRREAIAGWPR
ncbi:MAG TPA: biotin carboxylase N-terminal domain-containing protein [Candidatus Sulfotelmatobacter sp.]|nr:biotin carboxylase N-terminal domain-containing protein [Candidatus Sulfotelmatobacter sp.]